MGESESGVAGSVFERKCRALSWRLEAIRTAGLTFEDAIKGRMALVAKLCTPSLIGRIAFERIILKPRRSAKMNKEDGRVLRRKDAALAYLAPESEVQCLSLEVGSWNRVL